MNGTMEAEHARLFLAIRVPEGVAGAIARAQTVLSEAAEHAAVRWTHREQFHLTLRFLGDVPIGQIEALETAAQAACAGFKPMNLVAERIGFFPNARRPRVVWVGINEPSGELTRLQLALQAATNPFTGEEPEGTFAGHVTLGRIKHIQRTAQEALERAARGMEGAVFGEWTAGEVELVGSELGAQGARHSRLAAFQLGS